MRESAPLLFGIDLLDFFIDTVDLLERTSEYFGYKEEYLMARSYAFLMRKVRQYDRSRHEKRRYQQTDLYHALLAYKDTTEGKGKMLNDLLLDDYEHEVQKRSGIRRQNAVSEMAVPTTKQFKQEDFDGFAFMPPAMKERLKKQES